MNISYTIFTVLLLLFGITILVLSSVGFASWNKLSIPDNVGCMVDFPNKNITNLSLNKNSQQNFIQYSETYECEGIRKFSINLDIKSQRVPFIIGAQYSMDKNVWVDINESVIMSRSGVSQQSFTLNDSVNYIRLQIITQGEGVEINSITLQGEVKTQTSDKSNVKNTYIVLIVVSCLVFFIFGISVWIRYQKKKDSLPELIPNSK